MNYENINDCENCKHCDRCVDYEPCKTCREIDKPPYWKWEATECTTNS